MKKIFTILTILMMFPLSVFASGNITVSPSTIKVEVGSTKTITITAKNTIGDVSITSSNNSVAKVNVNEWGTGMVEEGQTKTGSIRVTGVSEGTATITFTIDAATFDSEDLSGQKRTVTVTVVPKSTTMTKKTTTTITTKKTEEIILDSNNRLKMLCASNYTCTKVNETTYKLVVPENINSINITADKESEKAIVTGIGTKDLTSSENKFTITVTSESGQNKDYILEVVKEKKETTKDNKEINYYQIIAIVEFVFIIILLISLISSKRKA